MSQLDWISPVDRARLGNTNDVMSRLDSLETSTDRHDALTVQGSEVQDFADDLGMTRSGALYFGTGDPYDLTTSPNGMLTDSLGVHIYNAVEVARFGDLINFLSYATDTYGVAIGNLNAYLAYDPVNGLRIKGTIASFGTFPEAFDEWDQVIQGVPNGLATVFSVPNQYVNGTLHVIQNGLWLQESVDYTETTSTVFNMVTAPLTADLLRINYVSSTQTIVYNETPTGTINGINTVFHSANVRLAGSIMVFQNGLTLDLNTDYTDAGIGIQFTLAPHTGDILRAAYLVNANVKFVSQEVPTGLINGSNTVFTLANNYQAGTPLVVLNGLKQGITTDYTESGANQITFTTAPLTGDRLWVTYLKV